MADGRWNPAQTSRRRSTEILVMSVGTNCRMIGAISGDTLAASSA